MFNLFIGMEALGFLLGSEITTATTEDRFGQSVCMNKNGNIIGVGATVDDTNGFVRIYEWIGSEWLQLGNEIISPTIADNFGGSISMSDDGYTIIIGDSFNDDLGNNVGECVVYSFDADTSSWNQLEVILMDQATLDFLVQRSI